MGGATLKRESLNSSKVSHQVGSDKEKNPMTFLLIYLQEKNKICVQLLNAQGYNVDLLAAKLSKEVVSAREKRTVTYPKE